MAVPASTLEALSPRAPRRAPANPAPGAAPPGAGRVHRAHRRRPVPRYRARGARGRSGRLGRHRARRRALYAITVLGVTAGYHRLFTHRAFVACRPLKIALAVMGSFALEGSLTSWVANHRVHHRISDHDGDPHSPYAPTRRSAFRGLLHAHVGWLFRPGPNIERRDVADLLVDRDLVVVSRLFPLFAVATFRAAVRRRMGRGRHPDRRDHRAGVGRPAQDRAGAPRHLEHQLGVPHVRDAAVPQRRPVEQRGRARGALTRRVVAQRTPCVPPPCPSRHRPRSARSHRARDTGLGADGLGPRRALAAPRGARPQAGSFLVGRIPLIRSGGSS